MALISLRKIRSRTKDISSKGANSDDHDELSFSEGTGAGKFYLYLNLIFVLFVNID
jgi:hypothetical protein